MSKLALLGGDAVRQKLFPAYNTIGEEEKQAVMNVLDGGVLSQFYGSWCDDFYGGDSVKCIEQLWKEKFDAQYAVSVNSNTSGLYCAMGACGVGPGDEVIVSPYTMTASAVAPMIYGGVPVFADIGEDTFCLDPKSIEEKITAKTKAIIVVHLFGHAADMDPIMDMAKANNITVVEDCAQAPMATYKDRLVGTIGDLGVFSLNYHKHIHTGEGGMITTNNEKLAEHCQLIRNHAEAVVDDKGTKTLAFPVGFNFRMTEIEAAIGCAQLKKLPGLIDQRIKNAEYLAEEIGQLPGITPAAAKRGCRHVYYVQAFKFKSQEAGISRETFIKALNAELPSAHLRENDPLIGSGYAKPLYNQSIYHGQGARYPYNSPLYEGKVSYEPGICPVAERMHEKELFFHEFIRPSMGQLDLEDVVNGYKKIFENIEDLKSYEQEQDKQKVLSSRS